MFKLTDKNEHCPISTARKWRQLGRAMLYTCTIWGVGVYTGIGWETLRRREGTLGGEVLIIPLIVALFAAGWVARGDHEKGEGGK